MNISEKIKNNIHDILKSRVARNSIYNICGFSGQAILMLIFTPILIRNMGVKQYGLWMIANSVLGAMGIFDMGLGMGITKYTAEYIYQKDVLGLSSTAYGSVLFYLIASLLLTVPLYLFAPYIVSFLKVSQDNVVYTAKLMQIIAFGLIPSLIIQSGLSLILGLQRFDIANILLFSKVATIQIMATLVYYWFGEIYSVLIGQVIILWLFAVIGLVISFQMLSKIGLIFYFSWNYGKYLVKFSIQIFLQNIGGRIFSSVDRLVVGRLLGFEAVTYYSIGTDIASKIVQVNGNIFQSFLPLSSEAVSVGNYQKLYDLFKKGIAVSLFFNFILAIVILIVSEPFLKYWVGAEIMKKSLSMFRILILVYSIFSISTPAYYLANGMGKPWICTLGSLLGGSITILLIFILSKTWKLNGAALANIGYNIIFIIPVYLIFIIKSRVSKQYA